MLQIRLSCPTQFPAFCLNCEPRKENSCSRRILGRHFHTERSPLHAGYTHLSELGDKLLCAPSHLPVHIQQPVDITLPWLRRCRLLAPLQLAKCTLIWTTGGRPQVLGLKALIDQVHAHLGPVVVWPFAHVHTLVHTYCKSVSWWLALGVDAPLRPSGRVSVTLSELYIIS